MRVVHANGTMRPGHDGVTRVLYRMREEFQRSSVNEHSFVTAILPEQAEADIRGVRSVPFPLNTDYRLAVVGPRSLARRFKGNRPDLIHIHSPCTLGNAAVKYARRRGIPTVATYHTHFPTYLRYYKIDFLKPVAWKYLRSLYANCQAVIVPSRATLEDLELQGIQNLVHIPHGVDTSSFSPKHRSEEWRRSLGNGDKVIVTYVGRLVWEKNLMTLVEASRMMKNPDQTEFVFVGDGPARQKMQELMPHAKFLGYLAGDNLATAFASSDIFVLPSVTETFGNVTVEAMASGLPAVCAAAGGAVDIVQPGMNGLLVPGNDALEFAQAIDLLVADPGYRKKLAEEAYRSSFRFQWKNTVRRYEELYQEILEKTEGRGFALPTRVAEPVTADQI